MFSAVLILILLTGLVIYALQVGVFEQRKSANEARYKEAFHAAESGISVAKEFFLANSALIASSKEDLLADGSDGWRAPGSSLWLPCPTGLDAPGTHPCLGESSVDKYAAKDLRDDMYFYSSDPDAPTDATMLLPIVVNDVIDDPTRRVDVYAILCMLDMADPDSSPPEPVLGCIGAGEDQANLDEQRFVVTLMARGEAECEQDANGNPVNCQAQALITEKIGSFGPAEGGPPGDVPLTSRTTFPPSGDGEIVPNPNAGGKGVPISAWLNGNDSCPGAIVDDSGSSWTTCERHEWYGMDHFPDDYACPEGTVCKCAKDERRLSYADQGDTRINFDIVIDENFPCDLFETTFGVSGESTNVEPPPWQFIKDQATVITDCGLLDENSFGFYWATGSACRINGEARIGSANNPVFLVSAADITSFNGNPEFFGLFFVSDVENANAEFSATGTMTVYGAGIIDASMDKYQGTFQIVYLDNVVKLATQSSRFGSVLGGWSDFPRDWR